MVADDALRFEWVVFNVERWHHRIRRLWRFNDPGRRRCGSLSPPERSGAYNFFENGPSRGFKIGAGGVAGSTTAVDSSVSKCGCK